MTDAEMFSLAGRTAIVTGAAAGIGEAIAIRLANAERPLPLPM
jgi:NAD(P)-dependent dehydrogenase (short-subunit alcohol dehydrogenase family)